MHAVSYSVGVHKFGINNTVIVNTSSLTETIAGLDAGSLYIVFVYAWDTEGRKGEAVSANQTTRKMGEGPSTLMGKLFVLTS